MCWSIYETQWLVEEIRVEISLAFGEGLQQMSAERTDLTRRVLPARSPGACNVGPSRDSTAGNVIIPAINDPLSVSLVLLPHSSVT